MVDTALVKIGMVKIGMVKIDQLIANAVLVTVETAPAVW